MTHEELDALAEMDPALPLSEGGRPAWRIEDRTALEWAMGRLARADREAEEIRGAAATARQRIAQRETELLQRVEHGSAWIRAAAEEYARTHRAELLVGRAKTGYLFHGEIAYRARGERVEVEDSAAALAWCQAQPVESGLVRLKPEIAKRELTAYVLRTGEIPPGVVLLPPEETITLKPDSPDTLDAAPTRKEITR